MIKNRMKSICQLETVLSIGVFCVFFKEGFPYFFKKCFCPLYAKKYKIYDANKQSQKVAVFVLGNENRLYD